VLHHEAQSGFRSAGVRHEASIIQHRFESLSDYPAMRGRDIEEMQMLFFEGLSFTLRPTRRQDISSGPNPLQDLSLTNAARTFEGSRRHATTRSTVQISNRAEYRLWTTLGGFKVEDRSIAIRNSLSNLGLSQTATVSTRHGTRRHSA
jgi:hypothetical protein